MPYSTEDVTSLVLFIQKAYSLQLSDQDDSEFAEYRLAFQNILNEGLEGITGSPDTAAQIVTKLESLSGTNRLDASAIQDIVGQLTGIQIKDLLETLTGNDRLAASAIRGLPDPFNFSSLSANRLPVVNSAGNNFEDSDIFVDSEGNISIGVSLRTPASEVRVGNVSIRNGADSIFTRTIQTAIMRLFGTVTFDDSGTANPIFPVLGARQTVPNGSQLLDNETLSISEGSTMSFSIIGSGIQDGMGVQIGDGRHIARSFTVRIVTGGTARLRVYRGTDASTVPIVDQTRVLIAGDNQIDLQSFPLVVPGQSYFIQYTSVSGTVFYRGSTVGGTFQPYFSIESHPYSEREVLMGGVAVEDEGVELTTLADRLNFTGAGVTVAGTGSEKTITIPGGSGGITIQDEGSSLSTQATTLNFTGVGVNASGTGASKIVNVPGLTIQEEGVDLASEATGINFTGAGVTASGTGATKTVEIPGVSNQISIQDEGLLLSGGGTTLNFTGDGVAASGTGSIKTINIPGASAANVFNNVFSYSATGTQNVGVDLANALHILASTITGFDLLAGTTLSNNRLFGIANQSSSQVEFDISATVYTFGGNGSGNAYNISANSSIVFYVNSNVIYPLTSMSVAVGSEDHPIIVTRDTPSLTQLATIADESLNDNSGFWLVANDQIQSVEDNVDASIQIRALKSGLLTADNTQISTSAVQKNTIRLQAGTQVRVFSSTDLRVISTPTVRESAARYPDLSNLGLSPLNLVGNQGAYNLHRNRTTILTDSGTTSTSTWEVRLPSLQNAADLAYLNRNDVFGFRNDRTDSLVLRVRTFQLGASFTNGFSQIDISPGQSLYVSPAPSGAVWEILQFGQSTDISLETISINTDWYRDGTDATAVDNYLRLHHRRNIVSGDIRNHIVNVDAGNNPVSVRFQSRNLQDDIAWVNWWSVFDGAVPPVGIQDVETISREVENALVYIENNINNGYDFEFIDPILGFVAISSITYLSGDTYRVNISPALPAHIVVNDSIEISGSVHAQNNGTHDIVSIAGDRLAFDIDIPGNNGALSNDGPGAILTRNIYADAVLVSHGLRQVNFDLYKEPARTILITSFPIGWFDTDLGSGTTLFAIGYNNDIETISSQIAIQDDTEQFFLTKGGPRRSIFTLDNTGGSYENVRTLPINFEDIEIRTSGTVDLLLPEYPDQLDLGESRRYFLHSNPLNDDDDVQIYVGDSVADSIQSDEGLDSLDIKDGAFAEIELYRTSVRSGWRVMSPINRTVTSGVVFGTPQVADEAQINPLPVTLINILVAQSEDPNFKFFNFLNNTLILQATADYDFRLSIRVIYTGPAQTGILFVPVSIVTRITPSGGSAADVPRLSVNSQDLLLANYTAQDATTVQSSATLDVDIVDYQGISGDVVEWRLEFGSFPPGVSLANFSVQDFVYTFTSKLRLD